MGSKYKENHKMSELYTHNKEVNITAKNFFKYATIEIIRFAFLLTDESLTSLAKKVPDLLDYSDNNDLIDYSGNVNEQLYALFGIDEKNQRHIREVLASKNTKE